MRKPSAARSRLSTGTTGATGAPGPSSLTGLTVIVPSPQTTATTATVTCPAGNPNVVSGGFSGVGSGNGQFQVDSYPSALNAWTVTLAQADNNSSWTAYALCSK